MTLSVNGQSRVPPGFRFHPTEEELLYYYLKKKVSFEKIDLDVIRDVDLNKLEPWDIQERCKIGSTPQHDWYFFSHKDKKYPTGTRTNRATAAGFWKATGRDKAIHTNLKKIGMRKTLVFYKGRAPHGQKTDWIMHEYRLDDAEYPQANTFNELQEDGWVVCRVFKKRNHHKSQESAELSPKYGSKQFSNNKILSDSDCPSDNLTDQLHYTHQLNMCKQELEMQQYAFPHDQFMQLPQLESPKIPTCNNPPSSGIKRFFPDSRSGFFQLENIPNSKRSCSYPMTLDMTELEGSTVTTHDHMTEFKPTEEVQNLQDWTVLDRLVASHLNGQEVETPKLEVRTYGAPNSSSDHQALVDAATASGDQLTLLPQLRINRLNPHDYSSCEIDLWNFVK